MNILFDFDGTICDSLDALLEATNPLLIKLKKRPLTKEEVRNTGTIILLQQNGIPTILLPFIVLYVRYKLKNLIPVLSPFEDIPETVKKLSKNHTLGIVTSNSVSNVKLFLKNNQLEKYFDFVYSSSNYLDKSARINNALIKHNLNRENTYFVGDETRDMNAAKHSGIKTIAVTWGVESKKLLLLSKPSLIVSQPRQILQHFTQ